jgi:kinesin family protein 2/24
MKYVRQMNSIKIMCRVKPNFKQDDNCLSVLENKVTVNKIKKKYSHDHVEKVNYSFEKVFDDSTQNMDLYNHFGISMIKDVIKNKKNVTFYVYGQTGSGKTHTLLGEKKELGIVSILMYDLLQFKEPFSLSAIEIYNNKSFDLFQDRKQVYLRGDVRQDFTWSQVEKKVIENKKNIASTIATIIEKRQVGISSENNRSSRSHLIIQFHIKNRFIRILDLAGCEKAQQAICANRREFYENGEINQNLFALKECIRALLKKQDFVPYRRCELTKILKQSFESSNKTYILATVAKDIDNCGTTLDVLNYIHSIKNIKLVNPNEKSKFKQFLASPRMNNFMEKQNVLHHLSLKEKNLLESMIQEKTTRVHMESYMNVIKEKRKIIKECIEI